MDAVKAVAVSASEKTGGVALTLATNALRVTASNVATGSAEDEVTADYGGEEIKIGVNAKFIQHALGVLDCEEVCVSATGELDPIVLRTDAQDFVGVIMPMRL
jgi:DNA polymerase-3 subunit beta